MGYIVRFCFHDFSRFEPRRYSSWSLTFSKLFCTLAFTPEGGLAFLDGTALQLLDLPRLNQQLAEMGLGW